MATPNWADQARNDQNVSNNILVGFDYLPTPIKQHMIQKLQDRPPLKRIYHVTEVLYCLRKAYYRRVLPRVTENIDPEGIWNIYRGSTFDSLWSPIFPINQKTLVVEREGITVTGTLDFVWIDEVTLEKCLYDLKMPKNIFYKKREGAGKFYKEQVQTYLAMAHYNNELLDVKKARILMVADDVVAEEVPENDKILDYVMDRAILLDKAISTLNPKILKGPEEEWECREPYCEADDSFKTACKT